MAKSRFKYVIEVEASTDFQKEMIEWWIERYLQVVWNRYKWTTVKVKKTVLDNNKKKNDEISA